MEDLIRLLCGYCALGIERVAALLIAAIRTFLNYALESDIEKLRATNKKQAA